MKSELENNEVVSISEDSDFESLDLFADELDERQNALPAACTSTLGSGTSFSTSGCICCFGCIACACSA